VTFNQKVLWKMLKDRRPLLTTFADKVAVRDYVAEAVGPDVLSRLYSVVEDPADLDPARLPDEFVVKPNHASAMIWIVADRARISSEDAVSLEPGLFTTTREALDWDLLVATCREWLAATYTTDVVPEWAYRDIPPRIMVEELLLGPDGQIPPDYKFFIFHGEVQIIEVHSNRFGDHHCNIVRPDWTHIDAQLSAGKARNDIHRPDTLERMIDIAEKLGRETDFVRVDLYDAAGRIVFGELTSYPGGGYSPYSPESFDVELGGYWNIPRRYR
jgi:hypothetical protein